MKIMLTTMITSVMIATLMMFLSKMISKKKISDREKLSPFECGFNPQTHSRLPFSIQFFLISMLFLIFDIEIALILPLIPIFKMSSLFYWLISFSVFIMLLLMGLYYEWNEGVLKWAT
uniref:NADH-ubiquinone oxidoreductase chain 3 n=1 Tax=Teredorus hainanensis TaxID=2936564 RepID=A0A8T9VT95_9ORTH|nr:NADH dehydrogenase subunit 3 [Teredorus hainanensis]UPH84297.1 NADH dehydrogenase subunit 3 [Teredorus hainanensis]